MSNSSESNEIADDNIVGTDPAGSTDSTPVEAAGELARPADTRELSLSSRERAVGERQVALGVREQTDLARGADVLDREASADKRDELALARDSVAARRDDAAQARDDEAEVRDERIVEVAGTNGAQGAQSAGVARAARMASANRKRSAADRRLSADDRIHARADRVASADDRSAAAAERTSAVLDDLTGVLLRGPGIHALIVEMARVNRDHHSLVVAFVDVDSLKSVNDSLGHAEGDNYLRAVADTLLMNVRPYDPVFRYGGDEFVCAVSGLTINQAEARLAAVNLALGNISVDWSVTIGLAVLQDADTAETLIERADADYYRRRSIAMALRLRSQS
ncbi:MAG: GGDEF domain-containing protein [Ilumatobacteraceae bacterium]